MGSWQEIESGVVQALAGLTRGPEPLFATVQGWGRADLKTTAAAILRERLPAALVCAEGRSSSDRDTGRPGRACIRVLLAVRSLRRPEDTRLGGAEGAGLLELSERAAAALSGLVVGTSYRIVLGEERAVVGDGTAAFWEQSYEAIRQAASAPPLFGGETLCGPASVVLTEVGETLRGSSYFAFPGIDGWFEHRTGQGARSIWWRGELRAGSDLELNRLEAEIEAVVIGGAPQTMVDSWGRAHEECVVRRFRRHGSRHLDELTGEAVQSFELEFMQLSGMAGLTGD